MLGKLYTVRRLVKTKEWWLWIRFGFFITCFFFLWTIKNVGCRNDQKIDCEFRMWDGKIVVLSYCYSWDLLPCHNSQIRQWFLIKLFSLQNTYHWRWYDKFRPNRVVQPTIIGALIRIVLDEMWSGVCNESGGWGGGAGEAIWAFCLCHCQLTK